MKDMLLRAEDYIRSHNKNVFALCLWDGKDFYEKRITKSNALNNIYSVSKTVTATAVAMLLYRGELQLEDKLTQFLADDLPARHDPKLEQATLFHLLTHSLGHEQGYLFEGDRYDYGNDFLQIILSRPLPNQPGEKMVYTNSTYYLLGRIVERITGKTLFDFLRQELFVPLHFTGYGSGCCPLGHTMAASEFFLTVKDMAKLGALYLQGGEWDGKRYFGDDFVAKASTPYYAFGDRHYGLSFWINKPDDRVFYGDGAYGQLLLLDPDNRRVLAMQSNDDWAFTEFVPYLCNE